MKSILLRISDEDHAMWSDRARKIGVSLSAWIRLRCLGYLPGDPPAQTHAVPAKKLPDGELERMQEEYAKATAAQTQKTKRDEEVMARHGLTPAKAIAVHQVKVERTVAQTSAIRTCPHGVEVSWRCTLCGGIVK